MPQATDELRQRWGIGPEKAEAALAERFTIGADWYIRPNHGVVPTENEWSAIDFLFQEWDYGYECPTVKVDPHTDPKEEERR